jgi:hypothetical protein
MPGSKTTPGLAGARNDAPASVAFRGVNNVGTRVYNAFAAQWLAYTLPYRRFAVILAEDCARIGGDVGCYSFIAVDSHHILLAGLPAHSLALRPAHSRGHHFVTRYPKASDISSPPCLLRLLPAGANRRVGLAPTGKRRLVTAHPHSSHSSPWSRRVERGNSRQFRASEVVLGERQARTQSKSKVAFVIWAPGVSTNNATHPLGSSGHQPAPTLRWLGACAIT